MIVIKSKAVRGVIRWVIPYVVIPLAVILASVVFEEKLYSYITLVVAFLALLLFVSGFEKKKTGTRRLIIASVMTALSVVGRFIPIFKPITALTIITAMYLGGETGFLVGAMSALISNFYFGQGPWTPFQMLAWGIIGLFAGKLANILKKNRAVLYIYGALSGVAFSFVMDIWTVLWYSNTLELSLYLSAIAAAAPYTLLYSVSNVLMLRLIAKPFGEKLRRVKLKYGV